MQKIVTVTMVKNEADIIELFVRYTMNFAFKMYIIDNGCTDETISILEKLQNEFDIEIYTEASSAYEQQILENKYIQLAKAKEKPDIIIPLDADEFLGSNNNLLNELSNISSHRVTIVNWKTYVIDNSVDDSMVLFDQVNKVRINEKRTFTKVIIPATLIDNNFMVTMGHHGIENESDRETEFNKYIFVSHFPVRSKEQIQLKVCQGVISQINSTYESIKAFHWLDMFYKLQNGGFDLIDYSQNYALAPEEKIDPANDLIYEPFDYSWCKNILPKYTRQRKDVDIASVITFQSLLYKTIEVTKRFETGTKKIAFIYGTGKATEEINEAVSKAGYDIVGYINSNALRCFSKHYERMVISPNLLKFFTYDAIFVHGRYAKEMVAELHKQKVDELLIKEI